MQKNNFSVFFGIFLVSMLFVPSNASAEAWYYHLTEPPSYAPYAKNLAMMALESWEDCGLINKTTRECIPLQFFPQPNKCIIKSINNTFFQWNNSVISNLYMFRANICTTTGNITHP